MKIAERFTWALSVISPSPSDHVLEIGCGAGILAEQIALQLKSGTITAIDKSRSMIKLATQRNKEHINSGRVKLISADFASSALPQQQFDKVIAFNVNFFWKGTDNDFQMLRHCLKPSGKLFVFYETPSFADPKLESKIKAMLSTYNFNIPDIIALKQPACICIIATA